MKMIDLVMKFVKWVNDVQISHAVVVFEANVVKAKFVNWIYACVEVNVVVVVLMKFVSMVNVVVKQVHVIDVTMLVNRMKCVLMENAFVFNNVKKVKKWKRTTSIRYKRFSFFLPSAFCPLPCLNGGRCTGFYQCTCRQGWQGHRCEKQQVE